MDIKIHFPYISPQWNDKHHILYLVYNEQLLESVESGDCFKSKLLYIWHCEFLLLKHAIICRSQLSISSLVLKMLGAAKWHKKCVMHLVFCAWPIPWIMVTSHQSFFQMICKLLKIWNNVPTSFCEVYHFIFSPRRVQSCQTTTFCWICYIATILTHM